MTNSEPHKIGTDAPTPENDPAGRFMTALTDPEMFLLKELGRGDFMQYGECYGKTFDLLKAKGLVQLHGPGEHQTGFIAQDHAGTKGMKYRAVSLTEAGIVMLARLKEAAK